MLFPSLVILKFWGVLEVFWGPEYCIHVYAWLLNIGFIYVQIHVYNLNYGTIFLTQGRRRRGGGVG